MPIFSVIIATRNRPTLFGRALESVTAQSCESIEIIVINDGSDEGHLEAYRAIIAAATRPVQVHHLLRRPNGHGQSYSVNVGAAAAAGEYLCFLDDDDFWTDHDYLNRIKRSIAKGFDGADLILSSQEAFVNDRRSEGPVWLEGLAAKLATLRAPELGGLYHVSVEELVNSGGFCHMNTTIARRTLFAETGGMDEGIRWECDHDLFLRLIDRAEKIFISPAFVARHNIPDPAKAASMTTSLSAIERRLYQLRVFDKAALFARHPAIRAHGRRYKGYTLKRIVESLGAEREYKASAFYAREALGAAPTLKWAAYWFYLTLMSLQDSSKPRL
jgi:glycosyltransferase involved in cell wall biosynthesis